MAEFIYTLAKARKAHGDKVILDDVTLSFLPGAKIGVVGPNGAGKSTLLKIMAGVEKISNGDAMLSAGYTVGMLAQEPDLDDSKSVIENVQEGVAETMAMLARFNEVSAVSAAALLFANSFYSSLTCCYWMNQLTTLMPRALTG